MKLRNKQTGEIVDLDYVGNIKAQFGGISVIPNTAKLGGDEYIYDSLEALTEEWEDAPVPKGYWYIRDDGSGVGFSPLGDSTVAHRRLIIGNRFESEEEAKAAEEKLKARTRLEEKGFRFKDFEETIGGEE